jgi:hypothetical protein
MRPASRSVLGAGSGHRLGRARSTNGTVLLARIAEERTGSAGHPALVATRRGRPASRICGPTRARSSRLPDYRFPAFAPLERATALATSRCRDVRALRTGECGDSDCRARSPARSLRPSEHPPAAWLVCHACDHAGRAGPTIASGFRPVKAAPRKGDLRPVPPWVSEDRIAGNGPPDPGSRILTTDRQCSRFGRDSWISSFGEARRS